MPPFPLILVIAGMLASRRTHRPHSRPRAPRGVRGVALPRHIDLVDDPSPGVTVISKLPPDTSRSLTRSFQRAVPQDVFGELQLWFGPSIDFNRVRVRHLGRNHARTLGSVILIPRGYDVSIAANKFNLVHELGHVWQYQNFGLGYLPHSIGAQLRALFSDARGRHERHDVVYHFSRFPLKPLREYTVEQQANLIACCFSVHLFDNLEHLRNNCKDFDKMTEDDARAWAKEVKAALHDVPEEYGEQVEKLSTSELPPSDIS